MKSCRVLDFEETYVHNVYDEIAKSRPANISKKWKRVEDFISSFPRGSVLGDFGSGRGLYLQSGTDKYILGLERSYELCQIVKSLDLEIIHCDICNVPYRSGCLDGVVCVAVIHHLATRERRQMAVKEIERVLKTGGRAFITAWAMEGHNKEFEGHDVLVPMRLCEKPSQTDLSYDQENQDNERPIHCTFDFGSKFVSKMSNLCTSANNEIAHITDRVAHAELVHLKDKVSGELPNLKDRVPPKVTSLCTSANTELSNFKEKVLHNLRDIIEAKKASSHTHSPVKRRSSERRKRGSFRDGYSSHHQQEKPLATNQPCTSRVLRHTGTSSTADTSLQKYYHVFTEQDFEKLIYTCKNLVVTDQFRDNRNWVFIVEKV